MGAYVVDPYIQWLLMKSPALAYGVVLYGPLVPYPFTITAAFTAAGSPSPILNQVSGDDPLDRDILIPAIDVDIQTKDFNTASIFKPEADLAYDETSGLQVTITQRGAFGKQYDQIPLKAVPKTVSRLDPMCLLEEQKLLMSFFVTTPLPSDSTVVTVTMLGLTSQKDAVFRMDTNVIFDKLEALGYWVDQARCFWLSAN
ncbi:MAG TPA: hypothetical protein VNV25_25650 [Gemmatimonadaceae bacterium]|jgi:hypothetical protein|nr:hypothetical protein [Gemmatimonadaceae bacterium]